MKDGFIKVCAATPQISVADPAFNTEKIISCIGDAVRARAKLIVLPELCVTGYTCGELFLQDTLLEAAEKGIKKIKDTFQEEDILICVGAPVKHAQKLYNCGIVLYRGEIKAVVPKRSLPNYGEFYEQRYFSRGIKKPVSITYLDQETLFGSDILIQDTAMKDFILGVEICEDLWTVKPPSNRLAVQGATVIANLSASNETVGKDDYRNALIKSQSARLYCAYVYADAGEGESTGDLVFAGDNIIAVNGTVIARSKRFENSNIYGEIDVEQLAGERKRVTTFQSLSKRSAATVLTHFEQEETVLTRHISKTPFVPVNHESREKVCEDILMIQAMGLKKRMAHAKANTAVIGVSGGLDSTLALLVTVRAFDMLKKNREEIIAVTMPCFGTTSRTYRNACAFAESLGVTLKEINIREAVLQHFKDIGQEAGRYDVTFENSQARERTQVLMDIANKTGGLVVGTGDLSELALGWATYNGDHMSMYGVNSGVPKTLIRYLVDYEADQTQNTVLEGTLKDILDTPVSPELLPPKDGEIAQKTEHIVGPYELHDFFLYYVMRYGFSPKKIFRLCCYAFDGEYTGEFILEWMKVFYRRFFTQQFKRSCVPDGPKVGSVALSPRGDWRMPSDASVKVWMDEVMELKG